MTIVESRLESKSYAMESVSESKDLGIPGIGVGIGIVYHWHQNSNKCLPKY